MKRRALLSAAGSTLALALSGCTSDSEPATRRNETTVATPRTPRPATATTDVGMPPFERVSRLGGASGVELSAQPERDYEYLEDEDHVLVQYESGSDTIPFDEWGTLRATDHAVNDIGTRLEARSLHKSGVRLGTGVVALDELTETSGERPVESDFKRDRDIGPIVSHLHHYARDGTLLSSPTVSFDALVEATPRTMTVTMEFPERSYTAILPVLCTKGWYQNA